MTPFVRWAPRVAAWVLVPAVGVGLRLAPLSTTPGNTWVADAAGHDRLVAALVEHGRLPDPDPMTDLPAGRRLGRYLPLGLYSAAATWHRIAAWLGARSLDQSLVLFTALAGALIAWPVWMGARSLGAGPWGAATASLFSVLAPAHLQRTTAFMLRYDAPGALLVAVHTLAGIAALTARSTRRIAAFAVLSGAALIAALAVWRVPLVIPAAEAVAVALVAVSRPPSPALRAWSLATAVALVVSSVAFEYLRAQTYLLAPATLLVAAVAAVLQMPFLVHGGSRAVRAVALLAAVAGGVVLGSAFGARGDYQLLASLLRHRAGLVLGREVVADRLTGLMLSVKELGPMAITELWGGSMFSWVGLWLLAAPLALWLRSGRPLGEWLRRGRMPMALLAIVTAGVLALSLLAMRHRILLVPMVASFLGACVSALGEGAAGAGGAGGGAEPLRGPAGNRTRGRPARRDGPARSHRGRSGAARMLATRFLQTALVISIGVLLRDAWASATGSITRLDPGMSATIAWLRRQPDHGPVLCSWDHGYEIQRYADRATASDGMLESPVNQEHILTAARAFLARGPDSLAAFCDRLGVEYVVAPPGASLYGEALAAADPIAPKLAIGTPLTPEEADRVLIRMILTGGREGGFEPRFAGAGYRIYRRAATPVGSNPRAGVTSAAALR